VAEQLARLDLTSVRPTPSVGHDTAQQANPDPFELGEFFDTDLNPDPDNRSKPERERFPVLSIPDLTMPVTPSPPSPMPVVPAATLQPQPGDNERPMGPVGGLEFPVRPSSAVRHDGWADREEPVLHDEVSPSLLSESVATASAGDLSAQWAADPEPETVQIVSAAAPAGEPAKSNRAATDEVENDGRPDEGIESLMFLRQARSRAFWAQSWVKVSMALLTLILLVLLGGQVLFVERNRLAAIEPRLQPLLGAMCRALGCDLGPFRRIEPLLIESSSFNKTKGEAFQLGLALHNASKWPLGMPSAELTLTDSQDQPVLRRVLTPKNLGAPAVLAPGAEWAVSLPVSVTGAAGLHIAGYRMLVFYP
jgi:hypothetical protein